MVSKDLTGGGQGSKRTAHIKRHIESLEGLLELWVSTFGVTSNRAIIGPKQTIRHRSAIVFTAAFVLTTTVCIAIELPALFIWMSTR